MSGRRTERPILFRGPIVRAILEGRKTVTRRPILPQPVLDPSRQRWAIETSRFALSWWSDPGPSDAALIGLRAHSPFGAVGDRLWVREAWQAWSEFDNAKIGEIPQEARERLNYPADGNIWDARIRPSIHMPRWASRITLEVIEVQVERLQEISDAEARDEGSEGGVGAFSLLWDEIYGRGPHEWDRNPWVWVVRFRVIPQEAPDA